MYRIITRRRLRIYGEAYPEAKASLEHWENTVRHAEWDSPAEVRRTFNDVDRVTVATGKTVHVFNIQKNEHRLIAAIHFDKARVFVLRLFTHKEYDKGRWKDEL